MLYWAWAVKVLYLTIVIIILYNRSYNLSKYNILIVNLCEKVHVILIYKYV